ncbi:MerR family DNA-binding transcriptional regulator [uncultured Vagococcus sp.]|uniref:MerR family DNA-binding transcriptional regulator n=1 Tax=uncultured Vagococcus sp. TaxID=189676 RepID=UPI0028D3288E|nr:MerR family DNA-binding transcriptional regulator [uncultured Vagococcus sp.]
MSEEQRYSIGEIAKLFNIPASTIRYWEEKEIFKTKRNDENEYREFDIQTTIELLDVVFYRNLNVPIHKMKRFNRLSPEAIYSILESTETQVQQELTELQGKLTGIAGRKQQLENLFSLKDNRYRQEPLTLNKIVAFDLYNPQDIQVQLAGPTNFVLYKKDPALPKFQMGLAVPLDYENGNEELWRNDKNASKAYVTCLLETNSDDLDKHNYHQHEAALLKMGLRVEQIIAPYLATASNDEEDSVDYYKAWLEIYPI